jgi:drug/metabolite transporter (DMT)-like permease
MSPRVPQNARNRAASAGVLLLLSLLWASSVWKSELTPGLVPGPIPRYERQALPFLVLALVATPIALRPKRKRPRRSQVWKSILVGLGLFVLPGWLVFLSNGWVPQLARTALFTLVPVFTLVFEPHIGDPSGAPSRGGLAAALAAIAGTLLVFPVTIPATLEVAGAYLALILAAACIAAANCLGVAIATPLRRESTFPIAAMAAIAGTTAAITQAAASALMEEPILKWETVAPELFWSAVIEAPALMLLFWLMPRLSATKMATRYVLAPLLAILIGAELLRSAQDLHLRTWLGLALMALGSAWLLFAPESEVVAAGLRLDLNWDRNE